MNQLILSRSKTRLVKSEESEKYILKKSQISEENTVVDLGTKFFVPINPKIYNELLQKKIIYNMESLEDIVCAALWQFFSDCDEYDGTYPKNIKNIPRNPRGNI